MKISLAPTKNDLQPSITLELPSDQLDAVDVLDLVYDALVAYGYHESAVEDAFSKMSAIYTQVDVPAEDHSTDSYIYSGGFAPQRRPEPRPEIITIYLDEMVDEVTPEQMQLLTRFINE